MQRTKNLNGSIRCLDIYEIQGLIAPKLAQEIAHKEPINLQLTVENQIENKSRDQQ